VYTAIVLPQLADCELATAEIFEQLRLSLIRRAATAFVTAALVFSGPTVAQALAVRTTRAVVVTSSRIGYQQDTARKRAAGRTRADSARRDTTSAGNPQQGKQANPQKANQQNAPADDSGFRKIGMAVIALTLLVAAYVGYRVIFGSHREGHEHDIPIIFQPRQEVRSVPEFPGARTRAAPLPIPAPPPAPTAANDGNHKPRSMEHSAPSAASNPAQGTLQLLPGRLEVAAGMATQKEIRFVRVPGKAEITFGRYTGEPHTHIQVDSPTVSRKHASMRFHLNRWHITNLSSTNPVVVNGEQLPENEERLLMDGDQVEMGEVIFRFRAR
jgi:hypothetical protein